MIRLVCQVIIYKTYYYYYSTPGLKESPLSYTFKELQLPDNTLPSLRQSL